MFVQLNTNHLKIDELKRAFGVHSSKWNKKPKANKKENQTEEVVTSAATTTTSCNRN